MKLYLYAWLGVWFDAWIYLLLNPYTLDRKQFYRLGKPFKRGNFIQYPKFIILPISAFSTGILFFLENIYTGILLFLN